MKLKYYRTIQQGRTETHLEGISDTAFCGLDLSGDDLIHDKDPEELTERPSRITCRQCLDLLEIAKSHLRAK